MAYCDKCGAYIPDGQTKCLACGYDGTAEKEAAASAAQSEPNNNGRIDSEFLRRQMEQQRERQRENSRKWAEAERARRQQQTTGKGAAHSQSTARPQYTDFTSRSAAPNKTMAALSYLGILCVLPFVACPGDEFAAFHARQGVGLLIAGVAANLVCSLLGISWIATALWIFMIYKGMSTAIAGKSTPLPYIGELFIKK